jgi:hypothetical protein
MKFRNPENKEIWENKEKYIGKLGLAKTHRVGLDKPCLILNIELSFHGYTENNVEYGVNIVALFPDTIVVLEFFYSHCQEYFQVIL